MQTIQPAKKSAFAGCYPMKGSGLSYTFLYGKKKNINFPKFLV